MSKYLQIDPEGYLISSGIRIQDEEFGRSVLQNLKLEDFTYSAEIDGHKVIVESFDEPIMALDIEPLKDLEWRLLAPYGYETQFNLNTLWLDEWDRFGGTTISGCSFVLSRAAQARFFDTLDEFDDDSITFQGVKYKPHGRWKSKDDVSYHQFWSQIYSEDKTPPWDLETYNPVLETATAQLKLNKLRILVVGAGRAHDAVYFSRQGHIVTALDFSPEAKRRFEEFYPQEKENLQYVIGDIFNPPQDWKNSFDLIFDHTLFCAIDPYRRNELIKTWTLLLHVDGSLLSIFFAMDKPAGPPYGATEWEIAQRLKDHFNLVYWTRCKNSHPRRMGKELLVYAHKQKKPTSKI